MSDNLTVEFTNEHGQRFAISKAFDQREIACLRRVPLMTLRVGFSSITLPRETLASMLAAVSNAEMSGSAYPDDWRGFNGVDAEPRARIMPGARARDEARDIIRELVDCLALSNPSPSIPENFNRKHAALVRAGAHLQQQGPQA